MFEARIGCVIARGSTEEAALRNAVARIIGRRPRLLHVERPVPGGSTRYVQVARRVPRRLGGGVNLLSDRMVAHVTRI